MNKQISKTIAEFFKEDKRKKIKKVNNLCAKRKKKCLYTTDGHCRGYCLI